MVGVHGWSRVHEWGACVGSMDSMHKEVSKLVSRTYLDEVVVNPCPIGQKEAAARRQAVEEEELLLGA